MVKFIIPPTGKPELEKYKIVRANNEIRTAEELKAEADNKKHDRKEKIFDSVTNILIKIMPTLVIVVISSSLFILFVVLRRLYIEDLGAFMDIAATVAKIGSGIVAGIFVKMGLLSKT